MKSLTIALATAKEAIRQPAFFVLAAIAGFWLIASIFIAYFTFGEDIKMYKDTGLTTISFVCLLLALLTSSSTVAEEIEGKTAITLVVEADQSPSVHHRQIPRHRDGHPARCSYFLGVDVRPGASGYKYGYDLKRVGWRSARAWSSSSIRVKSRSCRDWPWRSSR